MTLLAGELQTSLFHAGVVAGGNAMFNKAAVKRETTALRPSRFYLWWLKVVLAGSLLSRTVDTVQRFWRNSSSHFIYGSFLSHFLMQVMNLDPTECRGTNLFRGAVLQMLYVVDYAWVKLWINNQSLWNMLTYKDVSCHGFIWDIIDSASCFNIG